MTNIAPFPQATWSKKNDFSQFSITINILRSDGKLPKMKVIQQNLAVEVVLFQSFSVILAWDNQKGTFLTHFVNFGHEGAPNVTKLTYNMIILWENSHRKKNWGSFVHRGLRYDFLRKKIWTVPLILQFNIYSHILLIISGESEIRRTEQTKHVCSTRPIYSLK